MPTSPGLRPAPTVTNHSPRRSGACPKTPSAHCPRTSAASTAAGIQRLGFAGCAAIVCSLCSNCDSVFPTADALTHAGLDATALWQHTLAVAVSAETIATYARNDRSLAYLAGILHPVGMVALDIAAQRRHLPARQPDERLPDWEYAHFGTDNAAIAARVLRHWKFPDTLSAIVAGRYLPGAAGDQTGPASLLHVASILAEKLGGGLAGERGLFLPAVDRITAAGLRWDEFGDAEVDAAQNLQRTRAMLNLD
ncbi:MAG: HDOD domain-containing protein [Opitutaceae bacterium]|nr:HDOD domain-containing protein [Opitutaceae bacterium]